MSIKVSRGVLELGNEWKHIVGHAKRVRPEVTEACENAMREVLSYPGCQADDAVAAISSPGTNSSQKV